MPQPTPFVHVRITDKQPYTRPKKESYFSSPQFAALVRESFAPDVLEFEAILDLILTAAFLPESYVLESRLAHYHQICVASAAHLAYQLTAISPDVCLSSDFAQSHQLFAD
ncbi:hypothetical protein [Vibrio parahaemolyticus]|uniref:hypothetical protein n=1 Tax=Vibrio parahaemolyticus TaxID=670 RepID=UPI0015DFF5C3|nr:hypothetical protein [Vibrio parahaemolyticus]